MTRSWCPACPNARTPGLEQANFHQRIIFGVTSGSCFPRGGWVIPGRGDPGEIAHPTLPKTIGKCQQISTWSWSNRAQRLLLHPPTPPAINNTHQGVSLVPWWRAWVFEFTPQAKASMQALSHYWGQNSWTAPRKGWTDTKMVKWMNQTKGIDQTLFYGKNLSTWHKWKLEHMISLRVCSDRLQHWV